MLFLMRSDNPWMKPIVVAIISGLIVGLILWGISEHKEEELLKCQIDSSVQNAENLLNIGSNLIKTVSNLSVF